MTIVYKSLLAASEDTRLPPSTSKGLCQCTRLRVISLLCVFLVACVLIMYTCMDQRAYSACCILRPRNSAIKEEAVASKARGTDSNATKFSRAKRRLPKAIIIGVRKGGTRALLQFLSLHPNIAAVAPEVHFFDREENYSRGIDWYRRRMPFTTPDQITVEKTPAYFNAADVPQRVHNMDQNMKLILIVRDPVERAISDYTQIHYNKVTRGKYHTPFRELALEAGSGRVRRSYIAIKRSLYHRHILKWLDYFTLDNFLILDSQKLIDEPFEVVRRTENFLNLPHVLDRSNFYFNETRGFYCMKKDKQYRCLSSSKGRPHVPVESDTKDRLREFFRPFNRKFYHLVGRDFGWP